MKTREQMSMLYDLARDPREWIDRDGKAHFTDGVFEELLEFSKECAVSIEEIENASNQPEDMGVFSLESAVQGAMLCGENALPGDMRYLPAPSDRWKGSDMAAPYFVGIAANTSCPEGTGEFVPCDSSHLAHKQIEKAPKALRGAIRYAQGDQDLGIFRVGVRHSMVTGELEVALWTKPGSFPRGLFAKTLSTAVKATSVVRVLADPGKARKIKGVEILDGRGYWRERIGDVQYSTQAPSFFQVNTAQAGKLVGFVLEGLGSLDGAYVADLYAGGGTFSIPLALAGADVVAVESAKSSVRDLRFNADSNGVDIDVVGGDAARELAMLEDLDALVVDPPRAGLADGVVDDIASTGAATVAYVSCDPATWARDVARFEQAGYQLQSAQPVDMFPQTYHVEVVSFFDRAK